MQNEREDHQLKIELGEQVAEGEYSNLVIISHSNSEFVLDFIRIMPNVPKAMVKSRIIMTPQHAKRLQFALSENIAKFEQAFGPITVIEGNESFGGPFGGFSGQTGLA